MTTQNIANSKANKQHISKRNKMSENTHSQTEYQTYREALSVIRFGLSRQSQVEAFDFLSDIYKKSPPRLRSVFVMALISTLTSFGFADLSLSKDEGMRGKQT